MSQRAAPLRRPTVRQATAWILAATVAGSTLLTGALAARMAAGQDPALAPKAKAQAARRVDTPSFQPAVPSPDPVTTRTS